MRKTNRYVYLLTMMAAMAAIVYVVTLFRFPLLGSKVHFANAMCLVGGMLLGPIPGGISAGLGSAIYDAFAGYSFVEALITFVSKFAMAWVCGMLFHRAKKDEHGFVKQSGWAFAAAAAGALTYVALYMLKTWVFERWVYGFPVDTAVATMLSKLPASLINALAGTVAAPLFYQAVYQPLRKAGIMEIIG